MASDSSKPAVEIPLVSRVVVKDPVEFGAGADKEVMSVDGPDPPAAAEDVRTGDGALFRGAVEEAGIWKKAADGGSAVDVVGVGKGEFVESKEFETGFRKVAISRRDAEDGIGAEFGAKTGQRPVGGLEVAGRFVGEELDLLGGRLSAVGDEGDVGDAGVDGEIVESQADEIGEQNRIPGRFGGVDDGLDRLAVSSHHSEGEAGDFFAVLLEIVDEVVEVSFDQKEEALPVGFGVLEVVGSPRLFGGTKCGARSVEIAPGLLNETHCGVAESASKALGGEGEEIVDGLDVESAGRLEYRGGEVELLEGDGAGGFALAFGGLEDPGPAGGAGDGEGAESRKTDDDGDVDVVVVAEATTQ